MKRIRAAGLALVAFASCPSSMGATKAGVVGGLSGAAAPDEFSSVASQALQNLTSQFSQFHTVLASHTSRLTVALQQEEWANRAVEAANTRLSAELDSLRQKNAALEGTAKTLISENDQLRGELQGLQEKLHAAEEFAGAAVEGNDGSETAELEAAEAPPQPAQAAPVGPQSAISEVQSGADVPAAGAVQGGGNDGDESVQFVGGRPQQNSEVGYADAFAGGDEEDSGEIVERPPVDDEPAYETDNNFGPSFLAISAKHPRPANMKRHLRRRRPLSHIQLDPAADTLPSTAEGFAQMERNSIARVQHFFDSALHRVRQQRSQLLLKQGSLNGTRVSLDALHSRLVAAVDKLEGRHSRLQRQIHGLADFLQRLVAVSRGPEARAVNLLREMPHEPQRTP